MRRLRLFLSGDVMLGRGIDQLFPVANDPVLYEPFVSDAREYVTLAEQAVGPVPRRVPPQYPWGEALGILEQFRADARIINLETSITTSGDHASKEVLYRMHPANAASLQSARIDCCCLANNHVLDWGRAGLEETLRSLDAVPIAHAGLGRNLEEARAPALLHTSAGRVWVVAAGSTTSGIPRAWGAAQGRPGVYLLDGLTEAAACEILATLGRHTQPGDVSIVSLHWGSNWGYEVEEDQVSFAHKLIEGGVAIVHGHSSHHVRPVERYREGLILYGCGDLINDYEGIEGYEEFRGDLSLLYLVTLDADTGRVIEVALAPMKIHRLRLERASPREALWLAARLTAVSRAFRTCVTVGTPFLAVEAL